MAKSQHYLDWHEPFARQFAQLLFSNFAQNGGNFEDITVVVASSRAARQVLIQLVQAWDLKCQQTTGLTRADFVPPRIITPSAILELVYSLDSADCADELERSLAWQAVLIENSKISEQIFHSQALAHFGMEYAEQIDSLYQELQRAGLSVTQASACLAEKIDFPDLPRWQALAELIPLYHQKLTRPDPGTTELQCLGEPSHFSGTLIVAAIVEMSTAVQSALTMLQDNLVIVTYAPQSLGQHFDELGCLKSDYWNNCTIPLQHNQITVTASPNNLADLVARDACELAAESTAAVLSVGVCDAQVEQLLIGAFLERDHSLHLASGDSLRSCGIVALCNVIADYLQDESAENLARLVRLPEIEHFLDAKIGLIEALDRARYETLPLQACDALYSIEHSRQIKQRLAELFQANQQSAALIAACSILQTLLSNTKLYDSDKMQVLEQLVEQLALCAQPTLGVADYLRLIGRQVARSSVTAAQDPKSFEGLGWLELLLDHAPCVLLAGMHEHAVPGSVVSDPWLPESARAALGLVTTHQRVARDSYILNGLCARATILNVYCARASSSGETPLPSQLLMRCSLEELPARVLHLGTIQPSVAPVARFGAKVLKDPPPAPPAPKHLEWISISSLKSYMRDPYLFALQYIAKLDFIDDQRIELDAAQFGTLAHEVIAKFSALLLAGDIAPKEFEDCLQRLLDQEVRARFAKSIVVTAALQIEFLAARLKRFAQWQRKQLAAGWRVEMIEHSIAAGELEVSSNLGVTQLSGRIDRIDYNPKDDTYLILDFKTGSSEKLSTRRQKDGSFKDLQLVLYSAWFARKYPDRNFSAMFLALDKSVGPIIDKAVVFDADDQAAALDQAGVIIAAICKGNFASSKPAPLRDAFGLLFRQDGLEHELEEEATEEAGTQAQQS